MTGLRARLKAATATIHTEVEQRSGMGRLLADDLSVEEYRRMLERFLSLYQPLEASLSGVPALNSLLPDLAQRWKCASLRADLASLGSAVATPVGIAGSPMSLGEAIGCLYVLEGSTLGAQLIRRALQTRAFISKDNLHFFAHYGDENGKYWTRFTAALDRVAEPEHEAALTGARRTFALFASAFG